MTDIRKFVRVFIGSPGDLGSERNIARQVADEVNQQWGDFAGCHIELVGWEDTLPGVGRPQEIINRDLDRCEHFLGIVWKRWGTPPGSSAYSSGFEEEFRRSSDRNKKTGQPEISLFFKQVAEESLRDPGEQLRRVMNFREELMVSRQFLFKDFVDEKDFEGKIRSVLSAILRQSWTVDKVLSDESSRPAAPTSVQLAGTKEDESSLSANDVEFATGFLRLTAKDGFKQEEHPLEIARLRLVASTLRTATNDAFNIGVHDANLLYLHSGEVMLASNELRSLFLAGIDHLNSEVVPIWKWVRELGLHTSNELVLYSLVGSQSERAGALKLMRLLSRPIDSNFPRGAVIDSWLAEESGQEVVNNALRYLAEYGLPADIDAIKGEIERNRSFSVTLAADAVLHISLREDIDTAITAIGELRPASVSDEIAHAIYGSNIRVKTQVLVEALSQPSANVRRVAIASLAERGDLPESVVEAILLDDDLEVRCLAIGSLIKTRGLAESEIDRFVRSPVSRGKLLAIPSFTEKRRSTDLKRKRAKSLPVAELRETVEEQGKFLALDSYRELSKRNFSAFATEIRQVIADNAASLFEQEIAKTARHANQETVERIRGLELPFRKDLVRAALDTVCVKGGRGDVDLVRKALREKFVEADDIEVEFIGRFGDLGDLSLLADAEKNASVLGGLLIGRVTPSRRVIADAIIEIAGDRPAEILKAVSSESLRAAILTKMSKASFAKIQNGSLVSLLNAQGDEARKKVARKAVQALTKERVARLLGEYMIPGQTYYYNVVHWLDLALAMPRSTVNRVLLASD